MQSDEKGIVSIHEIKHALGFDRIGYMRPETFDRWLASPDARAAVLGDRDTLREKVARAMALTDDYDGCFERVDEWEASPEWEREAHPDEEPMSDREDCEWWLRRADAALDVFYPKGDGSA